VWGREGELVRGEVAPAGTSANLELLEVAFRGCLHALDVLRPALGPGASSMPTAIAPELIEVRKRLPACTCAGRGCWARVGEPRRWLDPRRALQWATPALLLPFRRIA
jgi:hypothetical protein